MITLDGTAGITTPEIVSTGGPLVVNASAPDNSVVVNASGNVGIGTGDPEGKLHVLASSAGTVTAPANFPLVLEGTNVAGMSVLTSNTGEGRIWFGDPDDNDVGRIEYAHSTNAMTFRTNASDRMVIDSSGNLLVGTASAIQDTKYSFFSSSGRIIGIEDASGGNGTQAIRFVSAGNNCGTISTSTTATSYNTSSDYRLKHDIAPMTGALAKVALLKPVTYKWNADNSQDEGFIAHELAEVCPGAVTGEKDAVDAEGNPQYQGIDTSFLAGLYAAALQELKAINDAQAQTIESLTARVVALEQA